MLSTDPDYLPNVTPPGNYLQNVGSNIAYRNSDFSTYVLNEAAVQPNLKIENNLVGEIGSSDKVILFDTPWENQGNRMGGQLGFTLQDGSVSSHSLAPFFGQAMQSSWSNADIQAVNAAGGYIWPLSPSQWGTNTDLSDGGAAAGWWAYMIDQR